MLSNVCRCSLKCVCVCVCVLHESILGVLFGLKFVIGKFVVELVKFISDFRSIKYLKTFKKINNFVEGAKYKFIEINC